MFILFIGILVAAAGLILIIGSQQYSVNNRGSRAYRSKSTIGLKGSDLVYLKLDSYYKRFFMTKDSYAKIVMKVNLLSVFSAEGAAIKAAKIYTKQVIIFLGITSTVWFLTKDSFVTIIFTIISWVVLGTVESEEESKVITQAMQDIYMALSSIRSNFFASSGMIDEAISNAEMSSLIKKPMLEIASMLTSREVESELEEFVNACPFDVLKTFARSCVFLNEKGADKNGFVYMIDSLNANLKIDIEMNQRKKVGMKSLAGLSLMGLIFAFGLEFWITGSMPGTALFFNSPMGYFTKFLTLLVVIVCFKMIQNMKKHNGISATFVGFPETSLLRNKYFNKFAEYLSREKENNLKLNKLLNSSVANCTLKEFYSKKMVWFIIFYVMTLLILTFTVIIGKDAIYRFVNDTALDASVITKEESEKRFEADKEILKLNSLEGVEQDFYKPYVQSYTEGRLELVRLESQIERIKSKFKLYKSATFHWWFFVLSLLSSIVGWFIPNLLLVLRAIRVKELALDDVLSMQTLISIIMQAPLDLPTLLEQLQKQTKFFRLELNTCSLNYTSDPQGSIEYMIANATMPEFRRMITNFRMCIDKVEIKSAFSSLEEERTHNLTMRRILLEEDIGKTINKAKMISSIPAKFAIFTSMLLPVSFLAYTAGTEILKQVNSL